MSNAALSVLQQIITAILAIIGVVIALRPPQRGTWKEYSTIGALILLGAVGVYATYIQGRRLDVASEQQQKQLNTIQRNTEQPPTVEVNVPKPESPKKHGRVDFKRMLLVAPSNQSEPFEVNQVIHANVVFENSGEGPIRDSLIGGDVIYLSEGDMEKHQVFEKYGSSIKPTARNGVLNPGLGSDLTAYQYHTFEGPKLTAEQAKNLNTGQTALCIVAKMLWSDDTGKFETDFCRCFVRVTGGSLQIVVDPEDNRESLLN